MIRESLKDKLLRQCKNCPEKCTKRFFLPVHPKCCIYFTPHDKVKSAQ